MSMIGIPISLMKAGGGAIVYLLRDEFTDTLAAGSVNGTPAVPGPGTRAVIDTGDVLSIAGGNLVLGGLTAGGDPRYTLDKQTQAAGLMLAIKRVSGSGSVNTVYQGWDNAATGAPDRLSFRTQSSNNTSIRINGSASGHMITTAYPLRLAVVLRSAGGFFLFYEESSSKWKLAYVNFTVSLGSNAYPALALQSSAPNPDYDWFRAAQLSGPWATDNGIATDDSLNGSRSAGDAYTHEADALIEFEATTVPSGDQIEVEFRQQTANTDCWRVTIDSSGDIDLDEIVATVVTQRGSSAGTITNGEHVFVICDDEKITVFGNLTLLITYATAANFKTETSGELETEGTGGSVSDIISWPRIISGAALAEIDKYTS